MDQSVDIVLYEIVQCISTVKNGLNVVRQNQNENNEFKLPEAPLIEEDHIERE